MLLRARQVEGWKFRRQVPVAGYIADFLCIDAKLVIEVDGSQHDANRADDELRTRTFETEGYTVIRFWNNDVLTNLEGVYEVIVQTLPPENRRKKPSPFGRGFG